MASWAVKAGLVGLGTLAGIAGAEGFARWQDGGAFAHLHLYEPHPELGVRLRPSDGQWVAPADNPATWVQTNAEGFRGGPWPFPAEGEVVVVGDSQVFGLGVQADQTASAVLAPLLGRQVLNAGVPTYGPDEYLAIADAVLAERKASELVVVFNMANDLFELESPNVERHAVWDGWAVRIETAPESVWSFPGRDWLYRKSHLFFALRRAWHARDPSLQLGLPSEGGVSEVVQALGSSEVTTADEGWRTEQAQAYRAAAGTRPVPESELLRLLGQIDGDEELGLSIQAAHRGAHPGDIVHDRYAESGRQIKVTAAMLRLGAQALRDPLAEIQRRRDSQDEWWKRWADELLGEVMESRRQRQALATETQPEGDDTSFTRWLDRARAVASTHGVRLHVAILPLDLQVSPEEFAKYGAETVDMADTEALNDGLVAAAAQRGVHAISLMPALRDAQPGAFLDGDLHMTPKGQAAVGEALNTAIRMPAPIRSGPGMPEGRSRVPLDSEYDEVRENTVKGSSRNHCETKQVREWFRLRCRADRPGGGPEGLRMGSAPTETFARWRGEDLLLWMPLTPGRDASVFVEFPQGHQEMLTVRWTPELTMALSGHRGEAGEPEPVATIDGERVLGAASSCTDAICLDGIRESLPACEPGFANAGAAGWCLPICDAQRPCERGQCEDWQGVAVCL